MLFTSKHTRKETVIWGPSSQSVSLCWTFKIQITVYTHSLHLQIFELGELWLGSYTPITMGEGESNF